MYTVSLTHSVYFASGISRNVGESARPDPAAGGDDAALFEFLAALAEASKVDPGMRFWLESRVARARGEVDRADINRFLKQLAAQDQNMGSLCLELHTDMEV